MPLAAAFVSPLQRARRTAELAGVTDYEIDPDLREWDYGGYEGMTTPQIREQRGTRNGRSSRTAWFLVRRGVRRSRTSQHG